MAVLGELLFFRRDQVDLDTMLRAQRAQLLKKVDGLPDRTFQEKTDQEIAQDLAFSEVVEPLKADFDKAQAAVSEVQVEVHDRFGSDRGPVRVAGLRATKSIPFAGDRELWRLWTNPYNLNPPRGDVRGQNLVIGIDVPAQQADEAKRYIDATIAALPEWLAWSRTQVEAYNASIAATAMPIIQQRRARLGQASDLLKKLRG
jgi:hypothetical protein